MPYPLDSLLLHLKGLILKRFKKILKWFFLTLLFLIVGVYIFIRTPYGQNWIGKQVTKKLSKTLGTNVTVKRVSFSLLNKMHLEGLLIEDKQGDTVLYAGDTKVRITDWFIFKKEASLKYVGLENALIKFQRTDSVWRHQFIFDAFSSSDTSSSKKGGIRFNLKEVDMKNVTFVKKDAWVGDDMTVQVGGMALSADKLNLTGNTYEVNSLLITNPVVSLNKYPGAKPAVPDTPAEIIEEEVKKILSWNKGGTTVKVGNLKIVNGTFKADKFTERPAFSYFDGKHILFTNINLDLSNAAFVGDTVYSNLSLTAKERSGLEVKEMTADMRMTPQGMYFNNLNLVTNRSTIRNYFSMSYDDMSDMGDFIHKVKLAAVFDSSYIDSDDIALFAPNLKTWKKQITLKGKFRGQVDDMVGREVLVQAGSSTVLNGDITMTGLPDINQTFIDFKANEFKTTYVDAVTIAPALRRITNPDLRKISYVNFKGNFTGFIRDFVTFGTIQTNLGTVRSDLNMKLPKGQEPVYSGTISTDNFQLGQLLGDRKIGTVSLNGTLKGRGFSEKTRNTIIDGEISHIYYNGYRYSNININGRLDKMLFEGTASIRDPNVDAEINGTIDLDKKNPKFNIRTTNMATADLRKLGITTDSITFRGMADLNFTGKNLDDFIGYAKISDAEIIHNGNRLPFDSLSLYTSFENGERKLTASSNEFYGELTGTYNLQQLPSTLFWYLNKYYPALVNAPARVPAGQNFKFYITTYYAEAFLQAIDKRLTGLNNAHLEGTINTDQQIIEALGKIELFKFGQYNFDDVVIELDGNADSLHVTGITKNIQINDSLRIPEAVFTVHAGNNVSRVSIQSGASRTVEKADINAIVTAQRDGVDIDFEPSAFTINGKLWTIERDGHLTFRKNSPADGELVLTEGEQKIVLRTEKSTKGEWNDLKVTLTKLNLGDIGPYIMPKNRLEGLLSGNVLIENPTGGLKIRSDDIQTQYLRLDNDSLGEVKARLVYDNNTSQLEFNGETLNQENHLAFDGKLYLGKDPARVKENKIALQARRFEINILERFLGNLFSDMRGYLTGNVDLEGAFNRLAVTGKGRLENAGLRVKFTQCFYKIADTEIELTPEEIDLDGIVLTDTVTKNPIYIRGGIQHESFRNMFYALDITTSKPNSSNPDDNKPVLLLNTTYKDNKQFYGRVFGTGSLSLAGWQQDMFMTINASASEVDSSYVTLPPATSRESGIADFLVERKYGREMTDEEVKGNETNIIYDVNITANPAVTVKVQLDELTGDEIKGKGRGTLNMRSGTTEPLSLRGRFDIEEGNYIFTFQSFFKKPFELRKGDRNYIQWDGDPYKANVSLDAYYLAKDVSFRPLTQLLNLDNSSLESYRDDVYVAANMRGDLFKPDFDFKLDFPESGRVKNDPSLALSLQQLESNTNEMNKQVAYLIVFNSFAPVENSFGNTVFNELYYSTLSGLLFNEISKAVNNAFAKIFNSDKIGLNVSGSLYNRNLLSQSGGGLIPDQGRLDINIPISITDRFNITVGSKIDVALQNTGSASDAMRLLPDVTLEWLLNDRGNLRASIFYRQDNDFVTINSTNTPGRAERIGANLSLRSESNTIGGLFKELFKRGQKKKKATTENPPTPPANVPTEQELPAKGN